MKKVFVLVCVLFMCIAAAYGAFCVDAFGSKFCGESCDNSNGSCVCTGACSAEEIAAVQSQE